MLPIRSISCISMILSMSLGAFPPLGTSRKHCDQRALLRLTAICSIYHTTPTRVGNWDAADPHNGVSKSRSDMNYRLVSLNQTSNKNGAGSKTLSRRVNNIAILRQNNSCKQNTRAYPLGLPSMENFGDRGLEK